MNINDLAFQQKATIKALNIKGATKKRFIEMGMTVGSVLEIQEVAPLGDPIVLKIKGYSLSVRRADAANIEVSLVE